MAGLREPLLRQKFDAQVLYSVFSSNRPQMRAAALAGYQ